MDETKDNKCSRCGELLEKKEAKKQNNILPIVIVICVAVIIVTCVVVWAIAVNNKEDVPEKEVVSRSEYVSVNPYVGNSLKSEEYNNYEPNTVYQTIEDGISSGIFTVYAGQYAIVSYETPSHAGINIRAERSVSSEKLVTLPEGTGFTVLESMTDEAGSQVLVETYYGGVYYKGYVFIQYIVPVGQATTTYAYEDYDYYEEEAEDITEEEYTTKATTKPAAKATTKPAPTEKPTTEKAVNTTTEPDTEHYMTDADMDSADEAM